MLHGASLVRCVGIPEPRPYAQACGIHSPRCCAANKSDLSEQRAITEEEGREASEAHNCAHYAETSAKTSEGIEGKFSMSCIHVIERAVACRTGTVHTCIYLIDAPHAVQLKLPLLCTVKLNCCRHRFVAYSSLRTRIHAQLCTFCAGDGGCKQYSVICDATMRRVCLLTISTSSAEVFQFLCTQVQNSEAPAAHERIVMQPAPPPPQASTCC